ncbi:MAG: WxcM-like domain-containing protein [Alphaproteobacteria bacterium]|nr:WxcM-like domain-containing protein [Candidatus Parcubacteria bacterium]NCQ67521.1 WxcM-like domain-containing protein [Alphaproteobacteria bacterium]
MHNVSALQCISFPLKTSPEADLIVYEGSNEVPFSMKRVFIVKASQKTDRGSHAHKECAQLLVVVNGKCVVTCDDGTNKTTYILTEPEQGLLIPPTIWAEQDYQAGTILMVLTDHPYEEDDYLRNYDDFLKFRGVK